MIGIYFSHEFLEILARPFVAVNIDCSDRSQLGA